MPVIDVAVVGAGPAGLSAAVQLAEAGLDVVVFEEHPRVGDPTHCTGVISMEMARLVKIPDDVVLARPTRALLVGPQGARCAMPWQRGGDDQIVVIDRGAFDRTLADRARLAGAKVRTSSRVSRITLGASSVSLGVGHERVAARACILACGVSYGLQRQLGLGLPGQVTHTAQSEVTGKGGQLEIYFGQRVAPGGFAWSVPIRRGEREATKLGVMAQGDAGRYLDAFAARSEIRASIGEDLPPPVRRILPLKPIPKTFADRVLVVGDAGGFTKPATGGGIFYGILTASLATETLIEALHAGRLDEAFLTRYEERWQARLGQELRVADWFRQVVTRCADEEIDALVRALASANVQAVIGATARFNWHGAIILRLIRQRRIATLLFRALFR